MSHLDEDSSTASAPTWALQRAIEEASSRSAIGEKAAALGLRRATDDEYVIFPLPPSPDPR